MSANTKRFSFLIFLGKSQHVFRNHKKWNGNSFSLFYWHEENQTMSCIIFMKSLNRNLLMYECGIFSQSLLKNNFYKNIIHLIVSQPSLIGNIFDVLKKINSLDTIKCYVKHKMHKNSLLLQILCKVWTFK